MSKTNISKGRKKYSKDQIKAVNYDSLSDDDDLTKTEANDIVEGYIKISKKLETTVCDLEAKVEARDRMVNGLNSIIDDQHKKILVYEKNKDRIKLKAIKGDMGRTVTSEYREKARELEMKKTEDALKKRKMELGLLPASEMNVTIVKK